MSATDTSQRPERPDRVGSFRSAKTIFRVRGVPVRIDVSWLLIALFVVYLFATQFAALLGDLGTPVVVVAAAVATLLFFASLLAHELGHALMSLNRGISVLGITLFLMGGVTESAAEAKRARDEFFIVGIGPFVSLVLAAAFGLVYLVTSGMRVAATVAGYLAWTNLILAVFNLVPGYPLDGGRLLRSMLWGLTGQPHRATRWAARVGQTFALGLGALGVLGLVRTGGGFGGLWEILIAAFLLRGATDAHRRAAARERLAVVRAAEVMGQVPPELDAEQPLAVVVGRLRERPSLLWPVIGAADQRVVGGLTLGAIDAVAAHRWEEVVVGDVVRPLSDVAVDADTPMDAALDRLIAAPEQMLLVMSDGEAVGLLTPSLVGHLVR